MSQDQLRQAAQDVLDWIETPHHVHDYPHKKADALRAALAEQEVCEWTRNKDDGDYADTSCGDYPQVAHSEDIPRYCSNCGKPIKFKEIDDEI